MPAMLPALVALVGALLAGPLACSSGGSDLGPDTTDAGPARPDTTASAANVTLRLREVARGLDAPVFVTAPRGDARLFVVEQPGRIRVVENGQLLAAPFLDLTSRVGYGGERGLLGLAFHPSYATNGLFFVNYTDRGGDTRVERYRVSTTDRNRADAGTSLLLLAVAQPFSNHNGGMLAFGPDGKLYVALGDGGSAGDPQGNGQNLGTLLGKLLRLDVDVGSPYSVPRDNPFAARAGARTEIWAYGLRNPWRFAFDPPSNRIYIADVGQGRREEIDVARDSEGGINWGWNVMEGSDCYTGSSCRRDDLRVPVAEYDHGSDGGCSITGGYVYRGSIAAIRGHYFYADYCRGWVRSLRLDAAGVVVERKEWSVGALASPTSFGLDAAGELYVTSGEGRVYRFEAGS
jgi:glucose/arabinose dehydrogenase